MQLSSYTRALLDDIERRIDPDTEEDLAAQWQRFWNGEHDAVLFHPRRKKTSRPGIEVRKVHINDALNDLELMLDDQLANLSRRLETGDIALGVRANYGTGIVTSLFGAEIFEMPREMHTLPTTRPFNDTGRIRGILEKGIPDLNAGFGGRVFAFGELCAEVFRDYPNISRCVQVFHPDTQGPLDLAELLWGGEMFYEMVDDPDFVHAVMNLITSTYIAFLDRWYTIIPKVTGRLTQHWEILHEGTVMLRNDSAMNLSPDFYLEYSVPYDTRIFDYYGGGCMHFCGRGDHFIDHLTAIPSLKGFHLSQPHLNDMEKVYTAAIRNGKKMLMLQRETAEAYAARPDAVRGMIHYE
ncbi:MAG: hypothetical protein IKM31_11035 [Oscillospiraceae bacterium]|nr:hypothetical protein [Oscillospiraceae bacterium]